MTLQKGFFDLGVSPETPPEPSIRKPGGCDSCGLYKSCQSPKMKLSGDGILRILIIGDAPGKTDDEQGIPFRGQSGRMLKSVLSEFGIDMGTDCYITNAVICRPGKNKTPSGAQIAACRPRLLETIKDIRPSIIIPLGAAAVDAVIGHKISGRMKGMRDSAFFGERIPDQEYKAWICPTYHPSQLIQNERDSILEKIWRRDIQRAVKLAQSDKPFPEYKTDNHILLTEDIRVAYRWMERLEEKAKVKDIIISFDYETTGLKPHKNEHTIISVSFSNGKTAWAFPFFDSPDFINQWRRIMTNPKIRKIAHKLDFEDAWTKNITGEFVRGWEWDTCLGAHCADSKKPTGLKFHAYINFGIIGYDDSVDKYLIGSGDDGANSFNRIREAPLNDLLRYNAMDSLFTFWLYERQARKLIGNLGDGFKFFLSGAETLSHVQQVGWNIDMEALEIQRERLGKRMDKAEKSIRECPEASIWKRSEQSELNFNSNQQMDKLLYNYLGHKRPEGPKTDEKALANIGSEFCNLIVKYRKYKKLRDTYLVQYEREQVDGKIYPFFNLHIPATFRSSSDSPNFQNVPKRDKTAFRTIRSIIRPRPGNRLIEYDYKSLEVCISACYHHDPNMIRYIEDPSTDMHRDTAIDLFFRDEKTFTKAERQCGKNGFVFPAFYGSSTENIAPAIWEMISDETREHLRENGIKTLGQFTFHVKKIETRFWGERFRVYAEWKRKVYRQYERDGYIELHTGFRCYGPLEYTQATNYAIQGSAFHCLLQALVWSFDPIREISGRSSIIGQIHDSIIADIHLEDEMEADRIINENSTTRLRERWPWIIVPLKIEKERSEIDGSWDEMKECKLEGK